MADYICPKCLSGAWFGVQCEVCARRIADELTAEAEALGLYDDEGQEGALTTDRPLGLELRDLAKDAKKMAEFVHRPAETAQLLDYMSERLHALADEAIADELTHEAERLGLYEGQELTE